MAINTPSDRRFVISLRGKDWGRVREVQTNDTSTSKGADVRCFVVFEGRETPCAGCPSQQLTGDRIVATSVLSCGEPDRFRLVTAQKQGRDAAVVTVRDLGANEVSALIRERLHRMASQAQLSERERDVLDQLMLGHRTDEIAEHLDISARTVKFHQSNILKKLGIDARIDLISLLL